MDESRDKSATGQSVDNRQRAGRVSKDSRGAVRKSGSATQVGVGSALRSVYDEAVGETVPQDLLDLLGKLD